MNEEPVNHPVSTSPVEHAHHNLSNDQQTKANLIAGSPLLCLLTGTVPCLNIVAPLIMWLVWKDKNPELDALSKNVLNSQISWSIWMYLSLIVFGFLCLILIGFLFIWIIPTLWLIFSIIHFVKILNGNYQYTMPLTINLIK